VFHNGDAHDYSLEKPRSENLWLRRRVPSNLVNFMGGRREIKLGTSDLKRSARRHRLHRKSSWRSWSAGRRQNRLTAGNVPSLVFDIPKSWSQIDISAGEGAFVYTFKRHRSTFIPSSDIRELLFAKSLSPPIRITPIHRSICLVLRVEEAVGDGP